LLENSALSGQEVMIAQPGLSHKNIFSKMVAFFLILWKEEE
jgi:hypothetical protein